MAATANKTGPSSWDISCPECPEVRTVAMEPVPGGRWEHCYDCEQQALAEHRKNQRAIHRDFEDQGDVIRKILGPGYVVKVLKDKSGLYVSAVRISDKFVLSRHRIDPHDYSSPGAPPELESKLATLRKPL